VRRQLFENMENDAKGITVAKVTIDTKHNLEKALRTFKRQCKQEGIFAECKERRHYVKPSVKKRAAAIKQKRSQRS